MTMRLLLKINDDLWSDEERAALMERALDIYLSKRRKNVLNEPEGESGAEPPAKKQREEIDILDTDSADEATSDEEEELDEDQEWIFKNFWTKSVNNYEKYLICSNSVVSVLYL